MNGIYLYNTTLKTVIRALSFVAIFSLATIAKASDPLTPLLRAVDLNIGESADVTLHDGSVAHVTVMAVHPINDSVFGAVRQVDVTVSVNGKKKTIRSGNYNLPVTVGN